MEEIDKKQASDIWWEVFGYVKEYSERHNGNMDDIPLYFVLLRKDGQTLLYSPNGKAVLYKEEDIG